MADGDAFVATVMSDGTGDEIDLVESIAGESGLLAAYRAAHLGDAADGSATVGRRPRWAEIDGRRGCADVIADGDGVAQPRPRAVFASATRRTAIAVAARRRSTVAISVAIVQTSAEAWVMTAWSRSSTAWAVQ